MRKVSIPGAVGPYLRIYLASGIYSIFALKRSHG